ncbi:MAG: SDR family oxidoreductase [Candidatus Krumholzibacteria bacterium]|nr:SDR family oxidoreductase [Candidatus Krumholzibacteria bacterium]
MSEELFLTGVTGYIGSSLLGAWLDGTGDRITVLARGKRGAGARERIDAVLADLYPGSAAGSFAARIDVVEGDVSFERLGIGRARWDELAARTTKIIHCAAAARFDLDIEKARAVNVGGTRNILELAGACGRLGTLDYIGTAYVAGKRSGLILEDELDVGQEHRNTYERSKMEAEKLVRSRLGDLPIAIMRPSIVICDSRTGRASDFNGFYRALRLYNRGMAPMIPGDPGCRIDLVPVDFVTKVIVALSSLPESRGRCYHIVAGPEKATPLSTIRDLAARHFDREPFSIIPPAVFEAQASALAGRLSEDEAKILDELRRYMPYLETDLAFDDTNTRSDTGLGAPRVEDYFSAMARYIVEHD